MSDSSTRGYDSWDAVKIIALLLMFVDHAGHFFLTDHLWLRAVGRGAAPVFLFLAGYARSWRIHRELWVLAFLMSLSDLMLNGYLRTQNILFTIIFCRLIFAYWDKRHGMIKRPYEWYIAAMTFIVSIFVVQYGSLGFVIALSGYVLRRKEVYGEIRSRRLMELSFVTYGAVEAALAGFGFEEVAVMSVSVAFVYALLCRMDAGLPILPVRRARLAGALHVISRYSGYIYALHLIALEWLTGIAF